MAVIDADTHVIETDQTWSYLDPSEQQFRPVVISPRGEGGREYCYIDGKIRGLARQAVTAPDVSALEAKLGRKMAAPQEAREGENVDVRLRHMDQLGVDIQVLWPTLFLERVADRPEAEIAVCKSWNRWLADIWRQAKGRLRWSCMAPTLSMPDALDQIRFAKENGACAVLMRPVEGNRLLVDSYFYPIYEEASRLDMAIAIHIANGNAWLCDLYRHPVAVASTLHRFRMPTVAAFNDIVLSEIPQVFPKLRWGFIEASAQWLPWVMLEAKKRFKTLG